MFFLEEGEGEGRGEKVFFGEVCVFLGGVGGCFSGGGWVFFWEWVCVRFFLVCVCVLCVCVCLFVCVCVCVFLGEGGRRVFFFLGERGVCFLCVFLCVCFFCVWCVFCVCVCFLCVCMCVCVLGLSSAGASHDSPRTPNVHIRRCRRCNHH